MAEQILMTAEDTIKWEFNGRKFCLMVMDDDFPEDPRSWYNACIIKCSDQIHYSLGDSECANTSDLSFWQNLVMQHFAEVGGYEPDEVYDLDIQECIEALEPFVEWNRLYIYDHSGISIHFSKTDSWDSGFLGWIVCCKKAIAPDSIDETWRDKANEIMRSEIEVYNQYLSGEVYRYELYEYDDETDEYKLIDACGGFYGTNILSNGIVEDAMGEGLHEAIRTGNYILGHAERSVTVSYKF